LWIYSITLICQVEVLIFKDMVVFERKRLGLSILGAALATLVLTLSSCGKQESPDGDREGLDKKNMVNASEVFKTETATFSLG
jgi:hypothetical protein